MATSRRRGGRLSRRSEREKERETDRQNGIIACRDCDVTKDGGGESIVTNICDDDSERERKQEEPTYSSVACVSFPQLVSCFPMLSEKI